MYQSRSDDNVFNSLCGFTCSLVCVGEQSGALSPATSMYVTACPHAHTHTHNRPQTESDKKSVNYCNYFMRIQLECTSAFCLVCTKSLAKNLVKKKTHLYFIICHIYRIFSTSFYGITEDVMCKDV